MLSFAPTKNFAFASLLVRLHSQNVDGGERHTRSVVSSRQNSSGDSSDALCFERYSACDVMRACATNSSLGGKRRSSFRRDSMLSDIRGRYHPTDAAEIPRQYP